MYKAALRVRPRGRAPSDRLVRQIVLFADVDGPQKSSLLSVLVYVRRHYLEIIWPLQDIANILLQ